MRYLRTKSGVGLIVMLVLLASVALLRADPGDLDLTFGGGDGYVTTDVQAIDAPHSSAIDSIGRIIVVGESSTASLSNRFGSIVRYTVDGTLDTTFGDEGIAGIDFGLSPNGGWLSAVFLDGTERIVVNGVWNGQGILARFTADGDLDTSFGDQGMIIDPTVYEFKTLWIDASGKITTAGNLNNETLLKRYNPDGSLDMTFGNAGTSPAIDIYWASSLLPHPDGGVLLVGFGTVEDESDIFIAKYPAAGSLDENFGNDGLMIFDFYEIDEVDQAIYDAQGRILVAGSTGDRDDEGYSHSTAMVARYLPDGTLDTSFGDNGLVLTTIADESFGNGIVVDSAGRILITGVYVDRLNPHQVFSGFIARYTVDGEPDTTFGDDNGISVDVRPVHVYFDDIKLASNDAILLTGNLGMTWETTDFLVVRYQGGDLPATTTPTPTDTATATETLEPTATFTPTNTLTPSQTATHSPTLTATIEATVEPTITSTPDAGVELVVNSGFETELSGWQVKNLTQDKVKCDKPGKPVAYEGNCAFRFKGSVGENSQLFQKPNLSGQIFAVGDGFTLQAYIHARGQVDFQAQAKFTYADDTKEKIAVDLSAATDGYTVFADDYALTDASLVKVKVTLKNKSASGKIDVDAVSLSYAAAAESGLLPLP